MNRAKMAFGLLKQTFLDWQEDKAARLAAALAYYTAFALGPLLLIAIAIAGLVFGEEAARGQVVGQIQGLVGQQGSEAVQEAIQNANKPAQGIAATIIGVALLLFGASGVFGQLQDALNTIWEVQPKPGRGLLGTIKDRFLSLTMVLGVGFLLLVSLVLSAALSAMGAWLGNQLPGGEALWQAVNFVISFVIITLLFALIFKVLPDAQIAWRDVWLGAAVTALLFTIGKFLIGLYLGHASVGSTYGAAGTVLVVLVWVYYSAQILFFGAEFTQVYANKYGSRIRPEPDAMAVTDEARAQQGIPRQEQAARPAREQEPTAAVARPAPPGAARRSSPGWLPVALLALMLGGVAALSRRRETG